MKKLIEIINMRRLFGAIYRPGFDGTRLWNTDISSKGLMTKAENIELMKNEHGLIDPVDRST